MKRALALGLLLSLSAAPALADEARFDGTWDLTLSCTNAQGALGYSFEFPATVKDGELHAGKGEEGKPGWLEIKGRIGADGKAMLYASGLVGAHQYAVGGRPAGTLYGYHIDTRFTRDEASGKRVEGRPCEVELHRHKP